MRLSFSRPLTVCVTLSLGLAACGGGGGGGGGKPTPQIYGIGGAVSGLATGESVILANNGTHILTVNGNNTFTFATKVDQNGSYAVTVKTQPNGQSCAVTSGSGSGVMANVTAVAVVCTNRPQYAYVVNNGNNTVSQYAIDASGTLSTLSVATVATGNSPQSITVDPSHNYAYVTNLTDNTISQYVIQGDGNFAPNTPATVATGHGPWAVAATGALTSLNPATLPTAFPYPGGITVDPTGSYAYLSNINGNTVSEFGFGADGTLNSLNPASVATGTEPVFLAFDPTGKYAYEANYTVDYSSAQGTVSQYAVGTGGQLTPLATPTVLAGTGGALTLIGTATAGLKAFMIATAY